MYTYRKKLLVFHEVNDRVWIGEVHYEANTSTIGWKEVDVYWRNNWFVSSYGGSIYFVMYFANSDMPNVHYFCLIVMSDDSI